MHRKFNGVGGGKKWVDLGAVEEVESIKVGD